MLEEAREAGAESNKSDALLAGVPVGEVEVGLGLTCFVGGGGGNGLVACLLLTWADGREIDSLRELGLGVDCEAGCSPSCISPFDERRDDDEADDPIEARLGGIDDAGRVNTGLSLPPSEAERSRVGERGDGELCGDCCCCCCCCCCSSGRLERSEPELPDDDRGGRSRLNERELSSGTAVRELSESEGAPTGTVARVVGESRELDTSEVSSESEPASSLRLL